MESHHRPYEGEAEALRLEGARGWQEEGASRCGGGGDGGAALAAPGKRGGGELRPPGTLRRCRGAEFAMPCLSVHLLGIRCAQAPTNIKNPVP